MNKSEQIFDFINSLVLDVRLRPVHIALSTALYQAWIANHFKTFYNVSRSKLMLASGIHSKATYHKTINDLRTFGYLEYHPSYHPINGSLVRLISLNKKIIQTHQMNKE